MEVASAVAGLIALADVVYIKLTRFYRSAKGAIAEIQALLSQVSAFHGVLNSLSLKLRALETVGDNDGKLLKDSFTMAFVSECQSALQNIQAALQEWQVDEKSKWEKTKASLKWPFTGEKIKEMIKNIEGLKTTLGLCIETENLGALLKIISGQKSVQKEVERMEKVQERMVENQEHQRRHFNDQNFQDLLNWLGNYSSRKHRDMQAARHPGTALWFKDTDEYRDWRMEPRSFLWLHGIPGAGKSVLSSAIIEDLQILEDSTLAYFYIEYDQKVSQDIYTIIGSLIRQLLIANPDQAGRVTDFRKPQKSLSEYTAREVAGLFSDISSNAGTVIILIDGVDEALIPEHRAYLLEFLEVLRELKATKVKTIVISRDEADIRRVLGGCVNFRIAARSTDLQLYVASEVERRCKPSTPRRERLNFQDPSLKVEIIETLVANADGMFLWVRCQLDMISRLRGDPAKREALRTLPPDLASVLQRILDMVSPDDRGLVACALRWISKWKLNSTQNMADPKRAQCAINMDAFLDIVSHIHGSPIELEDVLETCGPLITEKKIEIKYRESRWTSWIRNHDDDDQVELAEPIHHKYLRFSHRSVSELLSSVQEDKWYHLTTDGSGYVDEATLDVVSYLSASNLTTFDDKTGKYIPTFGGSSPTQPHFLRHIQQLQSLPARDLWQDLDENSPSFKAIWSIFSSPTSELFKRWQATWADIIRFRLPPIENGPEIKWNIEDLTPLQLALFLRMDTVACKIIESSISKASFLTPYGPVNAISAYFAGGAWWGVNYNDKRYQLVPKRLRGMLYQLFSPDKYTVSLLLVLIHSRGNISYRLLELALEKCYYTLSLVNTEAANSAILGAIRCVMGMRNKESQVYDDENFSMALMQHLKIRRWGFTEDQILEIVSIHISENWQPNLDRLSQDSKTDTYTCWSLDKIPVEDVLYEMVIRKQPTLVRYLIYDLNFPIKTSKYPTARPYLEPAVRSGDPEMVLLLLSLLTAADISLPVLPWACKAADLWNIRKEEPRSIPEWGPDDNDRKDYRCPNTGMTYREIAENNLPTDLEGFDHRHHWLFNEEWRSKPHLGTTRFLWYPPDKGDNSSWKLSDEDGPIYADLASFHDPERGIYESHWAGDENMRYTRVYPDSNELSWANRLETRAIPLGNWIVTVYQIATHPYVNMSLLDENERDAWHYISKVENDTRRSQLGSMLGHAEEYRKRRIQTLEDKKISDEKRGYASNVSSKIMEAITYNPALSLKEIYDTEGRDSKGRTLLHRMLLDYDQSKLKIIKLLCQSGVSILEADGEGMNILDLAYEARAFSLLGRLLDLASEELDCNKDAFSSLLQAVVRKSADELSSSIDSPDFDPTDDTKNPLYVACSFSVRRSTLEAIFRHATKFIAVARYGQFLLEVAIRYGLIQTVDLFIKLGVDLNGLKRDLSLRDTPLGQSICCFGSANGEAIMKLLLEAGAPVDATASSGETYLHLIASEGSMETLRLFLNYQSKFQISQSKRTFLHLGGAKTFADLPFGALIDEY